MLARLLPTVNLLVWALAACAAPPAPQRPTPARLPGEMGLPAEVGHAAAETRPRHGIVTAKLPGAPRVGARVLEVAPPLRASLGEEDTILEALGADLVDVYTGGGGERLEEALAELPARRVEQYGIAALTLTQLFGDTFHPGLCEDAEMRVFVEHEREDWELSISAPSFMAFVGDVAPYTSTLSAACEGAVADAGGDLDAALSEGCIEEDLRQFFPDGSACRACVEGNGGDFDACVEADECPEEAAIVVWIEEPEGVAWYEVAQAYIWGCAPDHTVLTLILTDIPHDGTLPRAFDHAAWSYLCLPYWDESINDSNWTCVSGEGGPAAGDTLMEGMLGRVNWMRPEGEDDVELHRNQLYWADSITFVNGTSIEWMWGFASGAGVFSLPPSEPDSNGNGVYDIADENYGFGLGGWGFDPYALRLDGTDPTSLDDTQARDWLATMAVKFATTRDGVPINTYEHNRCLEWEGPAEDGAYRCLAMGEPVYGWHNDVQNTWVDSDFTVSYAFPIATIASTGLPDPKIPGGIVPLVAGSPALADPDWDDCAWPDTFQPDLAPMEDTPADYGGPASVWGQTYRFGKDPDLDIRVVLNTNQARDFCPEEAE